MGGGDGGPLGRLSVAPAGSLSAFDFLVFLMAGMAGGYVALGMVWCIFEPRSSTPTRSCPRRWPRPSTPILFVVSQLTAVAALFKTVSGMADESVADKLRKRATAAARGNGKGGGMALPRPRLEAQTRSSTRSQGAARSPASTRRRSTSTRCCASLAAT